MKREKGRWRDVFRLAQGVQLICFAAILLLISTVLVQVYAGAVRVSRETADLNTAVQLCRNASEAFYASDDLDGAVELLGGAAGARELRFDAQLTPTEDGRYVLTLVETRTATQAGAMEQCTVQVYAEGTLLYELTPERYCGEVSGA